MSQPTAHRRHTPFVVVATAALVVLGGPAMVAPAASADPDGAHGEVRVEVPSTRTDLVSGGDALAEVTVPDDADAADAAD